MQTNIIIRIELLESVNQVVAEKIAKQISDLIEETDSSADRQFVNKVLVEKCIEYDRLSPINR